MNVQKGQDVWLGITVPTGILGSVDFYGLTERGVHVVVVHGCVVY